MTNPSDNHKPAGDGPAVPQVFRIAGVLVAIGVIAGAVLLSAIKTGSAGAIAMICLVSVLVFAVYLKRGSRQTSPLSWYVHTSVALVGFVVIENLVFSAGVTVNPRLTDSYDILNGDLVASIVPDAIRQFLSENNAEILHSDRYGSRFSGLTVPYSVARIFLMLNEAATLAAVLSLWCMSISDREARDQLYADIVYKRINNSEYLKKNWVLWVFPSLHVLFFSIGWPIFNPSKLLLIYALSSLMSLFAVVMLGVVGLWFIADLRHKPTSTWHR